MILKKKDLFGFKCKICNRGNEIRVLKLFYEQSHHFSNARLAKKISPIIRNSV